MSTTSREIHLVSRPVGEPESENFAVVTVEIDDPSDGQLLVKNLYMSVDPYMRGRMIDRKSYVPPFGLNEPMTGGCVGEVVASKNDDFSVGEYVLGFNSWREYYLSDGQGLNKVDGEMLPLSTYLGVAGMTGQTAYWGLLDIGQPKEGETVFVSSAAGAVGSIVCQIAKLKGCTVIGSAGSAEKVAWLKEEIGVDHAFNYKEVESVGQALRDVAPKGIDIYFENVGGDHLEGALANMRPNGRIPMCGMISQYNATEPVPGPTNLANIIGLRLLLKGFIVSDYMPRSAEFYADMAQWLRSGQIKYEQTIVEGIESAPDAFMDLFTGENMGKVLVKL
ncbi:MAG TPA: NADP-dependent oxidoreductase [Anaerolineae bacterium]|nr:NADP-dependent oxidoreductase [Anaerolineae bacterium]